MVLISKILRQRELWNEENEINTILGERKTYVVFAANKNYSHLMPLTAQLWYERTGFIPCCVMVYQDNTSDSYMRMINETLHEMKNNNIKDMIIAEMVVENYNTVVLSQNIRIFFSLFDCFQPDDFMITTDVDVWPVNPYIWKRFHYTIKPSQIYSYNYGCCGTFNIKRRKINHYSMHAIMMNINNWRKMLEIYPYFENKISMPSIINGIKTTLLKEHGYNGYYIGQEHKEWYSDEMLLSYFIYMMFKPRQVKGFKPSCRIDKAGFPENLSNFMNCYDSHIFSNMSMLLGNLNLYNMLKRTNMLQDYVNKVLLYKVNGNLSTSKKS